MMYSGLGYTSMRALPDPRVRVSWVFSCCIIVSFTIRAHVGGFTCVGGEGGSFGRVLSECEGMFARVAVEGGEGENVRKCTYILVYLYT